MKETRSSRAGPCIEIPRGNEKPGFCEAGPVCSKNEKTFTLSSREEVCVKIFPAGLLAYGSSYGRAFPPLGGGMVRLSSPITAAGPRRIRTVFPLRARGGFRENVSTAHFKVQQL